MAASSSPLRYLPDATIALGFLDSYRHIRQERGNYTRAFDVDRLMKIINSAKTIADWLNVSSELYDVLIKEINHGAEALSEAKSTYLSFTSSLGIFGKSISIPEEQRDLLFKTVAATFSYIRQRIYGLNQSKLSLENEKATPIPIDQLNSFENERKDDYANIASFENEIEKLKIKADEIRCMEVNYKSNDFEKKLNANVKQRNDLIEKWVRRGDVKAVVLAGNIPSILPHFRELSDCKGYYSAHACPPYMAVTFDDYFFTTVIHKLDHRTRDENFVQDYRQNFLLGTRAKPIVCGKTAASTAACVLTAPVSVSGQAATASSSTAPGQADKKSEVIAAPGSAVTGSAALFSTTEPTGSTLDATSNPVIVLNGVPTTTSSRHADAHIVADLTGISVRKAKALIAAKPASVVEAPTQGPRMGS